MAFLSSSRLPGSSSVMTENLTVAAGGGGERSLKVREALELNKNRILERTQINVMQVKTHVQFSFIKVHV
jgi:hypothetical protein